MDSNLLKTKSIEQLVGDAESGAQGAEADADGDGPDAARHRRDHRDRHLRPDRHGGRQPGRARPSCSSYVLAGLACAFAALCYAEFAAMIPISGSAYTYAYATLGEIFAWMIGWDLILEYAVGSMTVAVGWSGYFQRILAGLRRPPAGVDVGGARTPASRARSSTCRRSSSSSSSRRCWSSACERARASTPSMVAVKLAAILFFIVVGVGYVKPENWSPFMPYGFAGVSAAAAVVFFAYIGFDAVSTTAEEAKNPSRDLPIGIIASLVICTVLYLLVAGILSGIIPVVQFKDDAQFLNAPVGYALSVINKDWAAGLVSAGAVAGITSVLLVMLLSQPRIFFAMSRDNLLPPGVSKVHPRFRTPVHHDDHHRRCRRDRGRLHADQGPRRDDEHRHAVRVRRRLRWPSSSCGAKRPDAHRPFKVRGGYVVPVLGVVSCAYLMLSLTVMTWVRFLGLARPRHGHLLVLRPHPQPAGRQGRGRGALGAGEPGQLPEDGRLHADVQRLLHRAARAADGVGRD